MTQPAHHTPPTDAEAALVRNYAAVVAGLLPAPNDLFSGDGFQKECIRAMIHEKPDLTFPTPYSPDIYTP